MNAISITALVKSYGKVTALQGIDLAVPQGMIYGVVGPNGSGKTTMLSIVSGLRRKTAGDVAFGVPPNKVMLMPEGTDAETLEKRKDTLTEICDREGYRYCNRLHIELFGNTRGT